jgi:tetratricopeptide (TPR) repeat protein
MPQKPSSFERFWKELKRRKTGKVIVAYAATAFIVLQLVDILAPALLLPEWTVRLVIVILIIGFPLAITFSWIFDITPGGIKKTGSESETEKRTTVTKPARKISTVSNITITVLLIIVVILAYPKVFHRTSLERLRSSGDRISVVVMPFQNMTNDSTWDVWQDGIQNELINNLTNSKELRVNQVESINYLIESKGLTNYASMTPSVAGSISQKLNANIFIYGSIKKAGDIIRISAQIIDAESEESLKSFQINGPSETILNMTDSLTAIVNNFLIVSELRKGLPSFDKTYVSTTSPEALRYFIYGRNYFYKQDFPAAQNWLLKAISVDTNFTQAITLLSISYSNEFLFEQTVNFFGNEILYEQAKKWCLMAYRKREQVPIQQQININRIYAMYFKTPIEVIACLNQLLDLDDQNPNTYFNLGSCYYDLNRFDKAIPEFEKTLDLYKKWGSKPEWSYDYAYLGEAYHKTGKFEEEEKLYKKAEEIFPDDPFITYNQAVLSLTKNDTVTAGKYFAIGLYYMKSIPLSEASITAVIASTYKDAGLMDVAEKYYRQAVGLEPENPIILNNLAYFLINNDRNIEEGIELSQKALKHKPDYYGFLDTKGWGLYKKGKFEEASEILQKSWDLRMKKAVYDHTAFLHLEEAKKATTKEKIN